MLGQYIDKPVRSSYCLAITNKFSVLTAEKVARVPFVLLTRRSSVSWLLVNIQTVVTGAYTHICFEMLPLALSYTKCSGLCAKHINVHENISVITQF